MDAIEMIRQLTDTNLVGFEEMPSGEEIARVLSMSDYRDAISDARGFRYGIFIVVHNNAKYPLWQNVKIKSFEIGEEIYVYSKTIGWKGWKSMRFEYVEVKLLEEHARALMYLAKNWKTEKDLLGYAHLCKEKDTKRKRDRKSK